jgi:hypothetical protein
VIPSERNAPLPVDEVQWFRGSGSGVRSAALYGITKVHLAVPYPAFRTDRRATVYIETLCGVPVPGENRRIRPDDRDARCRRCAAIAAARGVPFPAVGAA